MLELRKEKTSNGYDKIIIVSDFGNLSIFFENNLDLYWSFQSNIDSSNTLQITKENYEIYNQFNMLYEAIKNKTPYANNNDFGYDKFKIIDIDKYSTNKLVNNDKIDWHSDDMPYALSSSVMIHKDSDNIIITFKNKPYIRFCNSGSRYSPFNCTFMNMYNNFKQIELENRQICFDEYEYCKKLSKMNKT